MLGVSGWRHILDPKEDMSTPGSIWGCMSSKMKLASMGTLLWFITSISRTIFLPTFTGPKSKDFWQPSYKSSNRGTPGTKKVHWQFFYYLWSVKCFFLVLTFASYNYYFLAKWIHPELKFEFVLFNMLWSEIYWNFLPETRRNLFLVKIDK